MRLKAKTTIILVAVLIPLLGISAIGTAWWLAKKSGPVIPQVDIASDGNYAHIKPLHYCTPLLENCTIGNKVRFPVRPGATVIMSLPEDITISPWRYITETGTAEHPVQHTSAVQKTGPATAIVIHTSTSDRLLTIEVQTASAMVDKTGSIIVRGIWAVDTTE